MRAKGNFVSFNKKIKEFIFEKIFHPNIEVNGAVCLNILREDWNPVLSLNSVIIGLQLLFTEPSIDDPLNKGMFCAVIGLISSQLHMVGV